MDEETRARLLAMMKEQQGASPEGADGADDDVVDDEEGDVDSGYLIDPYDDGDDEVDEDFAARRQRKVFIIFGVAVLVFAIAALLLFFVVFPTLRSAGRSKTGVVARDTPTESTQAESTSEASRRETTDGTDDGTGRTVTGNVTFSDVEATLTEGSEGKAHVIVKGKISNGLDVEISADELPVLYYGGHEVGNGTFAVDGGYVASGADAAVSLEADVTLVSLGRFSFEPFRAVRHDDKSGRNDFYDVRATGLDDAILKLDSEATGMTAGANAATVGEGSTTGSTEGTATSGSNSTTNGANDNASNSTKDSTANGANGNASNSGQPNGASTGQNGNANSGSSESASKNGTDAGTPAPEDAGEANSEE